MSSPPPKPGPEPTRSVSDEAELLGALLRERGGIGFGLLEGFLSAGSRTGDRTGSAQESGQESGHRGSDQHGSGHQECTCGATTPSTCRFCPLCRLIDRVNGITPETLDRIADVIALAVTGLRDLAEYRRTADQAAASPTDLADDGPSTTEDPK